MGSVPALSVVILGIVVPALAGYIEVSNVKHAVIMNMNWIQKQTLGPVFVLAT